MSAIDNNVEKKLDNENKLLVADLQVAKEDVKNSTCTVTETNCHDLNSKDSSETSVKDCSKELDKKVTQTGNEVNLEDRLQETHISISSAALDSLPNGKGDVEADVTNVRSSVGSSVTEIETSVEEAHSTIVQECSNSTTGRSSEHTSEELSSNAASVPLVLDNNVKRPIPRKVQMILQSILNLQSPDDLQVHILSAQLKTINNEPDFM